MEDQKIICHTCHRECKSGEQVAKYTSGYVNYYKCHECYCKSGNLENYQECDVYTRVVGFHTPLSRWHKGKRAEYTDRKTFVVEKHHATC